MWRTWHSVAVCTIVIQGNVTCCGSFRTRICNFLCLRNGLSVCFAKTVMTLQDMRQRMVGTWVSLWSLLKRNATYLTLLIHSRVQILYWCISMKNISQQILHFMSPCASLCLVAYATENQLVPFRATEKNYIGKDCSF